MTRLPDAAERLVTGDLEGLFALEGMEVRAMVSVALIVVDVLK